eukprot:5551546-Pleurochrysis_carterae.AAC.1
MRSRASVAKPSHLNLSPAARQRCRELFCPAQPAQRSTRASDTRTRGRIQDAGENERKALWGQQISGREHMRRVSRNGTARSNRASCVQLQDHLCAECDHLCAECDHLYSECDHLCAECDHLCAECDHLCAE